MGLTANHEVWARPPFMWLWHREPRWVPIPIVSTYHLVATLDDAGEFSWEYPSGAYSRKFASAVNVYAYPLYGKPVLVGETTTGHLFRTVDLYGRFVGLEDVKSVLVKKGRMSMLGCRPELLGEPGRPKVVPWRFHENIVFYTKDSPITTYFLYLPKRCFLTQLAGTDCAFWTK